MKPGASKTVRCAIYTRVSTDSGLDQEFNSLDAQHDAASAYIRSQAHAGWAPVRTRYDDGGFSGGSTDRPALQQLLEDVRAGKVNVIVVYKVDRLTRSLADFAKLVELFDKHGVSFVSVTQQFNTTTSMGRLTLNVLLSFAQFEREVTSERIRDKIGASKRKGLWVGGVVPLGYHAKDRKITVVESEANTVRHIFNRYLELGSINLLLTDLKACGIRTRRRSLATGQVIGGIPFMRGPLGYLLRNRFYVGEVKYKGEILPGEQPALLDRKLFDAVQARLDQQRNATTVARSSSDAVLMGLIFDDRGNRMTPTYALKKGVRYRYYISNALIQGEPGKSGAVGRVAADQVEQLVASAVRQHLAGCKAGTSSNDPSDESGHALDSGSDHALIRQHVARVDVRADHLLVRVGEDADQSSTRDEPSNGAEASGARIRKRFTKDRELRIAWKKRPSKMPRELIPVSRADQSDKRPIRSETRAKLVCAIAKGRRWLDEIVSGKIASVNHIADRERCSVRQINLMISLAFLSPALVQAAVDGRLPRGVGVANLRDAPAEWAAQHKMLGLNLNLTTQ